MSILELGTMRREPPPVTDRDLLVLLLRGLRELSGYGHLTVATRQAIDAVLTPQMPKGPR